jgi:DNA-binding MurR/RpiR family transcriptional regulator
MSLPLPLYPARPTLGVRDATDPVAPGREERLAELVRELLPEMRRTAPHLSERALHEAVERIAAHRLADEELAHRTW